MVPSMTSSPISTRRPPSDLRVDDDVEVDRACRTGGSSAAASRCCSSAASGAGDADRGDRLAAAPRRPRRGTSASAAVIVRPAPRATACARATRGRERLAVEQRVEQRRACRSTDACRVAERVAQRGFAVDDPAEREQLVARPGRPCAPAERTAAIYAEPLERVGAGRADAVQRRPTASATQARAGVAETPGRRPACDQPCLASAGDRGVGERRGAGPARVRTAGATANSSSPSVAASSSARSGEPAGSARPAPRRRLLAASADAPSGSPAVSASRGRRGSARPHGRWRSSSSRDSPTMRPARSVARLPTSRAQRGERRLALGLDLGVRVLDDPVGLDLRLLAQPPAMICAPCSRASSRIRAASWRASASCSLYSSSAVVRARLGLVEPRRTRCGSPPGAPSSPC